MENRLFKIEQKVAKEQKREKDLMKSWKKNGLQKGTAGNFSAFIASYQTLKATHLAWLFICLYNKEARVHVPGPSLAHLDLRPICTK